MKLSDLKSKKLYTANEVADILGYCPPHVRRLCREGKIEHIKVGAGYRFTEEQVMNFIKVDGESK